MNKLLAEFIGTFFLVLCAVFSAHHGGGPFAPAAALALSIFAMGHISGGHYNPAVSLGVWLRGRMPQKEMIQYIGIQAGAALIAVLFYRLLEGKDFPEITKERAEGVSMMRAMLAEFLFTFLLVSTVLNVATTKIQANNHYFGLAIGLCVVAGGFTVGSISGGAFNPAVGLGYIVSSAAPMKLLVSYLIGCFGGGAVAAIVFRFLNPQE